MRVLDLKICLRSTLISGKKGELFDHTNRPHDVEFYFLAMLGGVFG